MNIHLIWAQGRDGAFGRNNTLPWHLPEDLRHFVARTKGLPVIMGRKTWESLPRKPLPGRINIVVTSRVDGLGAQTVPGRGFAVCSLDSAFKAAEATGSPTCVVIGGPGLLAQAMQQANTAYVTDIDVECQGADAFAPTLLPQWHCSEDSEWLLSESGVRYRFRTWLAPERG